MIRILLLVSVLAGCTPSEFSARVIALTFSPEGDRVIAARADHLRADARYEFRYRERFGGELTAIRAVARRTANAEFTLVPILSVPNKDVWIIERYMRSDGTIVEQAIYYSR